MNTTETTKQKPRHAGMFKPGMSGNPSGRPKADLNIRELAKGYTEEAMATLVEVARNKKASPSARVAAASALLDRAWGKPPQHIEAVSVGMSYSDFLEHMALQDEKENQAGVIECKAVTLPSVAMAEDDELEALLAEV